MDATALTIRIDDLSGDLSRALVRSHLAQMRDGSPPESTHALDVDALLAPGITVWSAWQGERLAGIGALARLDERHAELKSMRVADAFRGTGVGRALLRQLMAEARARGIHTLWLETGSAESFLPAQRLYESEGFTRCEPFGSYVPDPLSVFMTRSL